MGFPILVRWHLYIESEPRIFHTFTHWGQVTLICLSNLTIIGSGNGLSPGRCHAITWTHAGILLTDKLQWNFNQISYIFIQASAFEKVFCKMADILSQPQCLNKLYHCRDLNAHEYKLYEIQIQIMLIQIKHVKEKIRTQLNIKWSF